MTRLRRSAILVFSASMLLAAAPARADALDSILDILAKAGVVDPAVKDAKPLIECMIQHGNPLKCVDVKSIAEKEGKAAAKKFLPDDPAIKATVEIVKAAYASDWIKLLEVTGTDLLVQIACKAGLSTTGPLKNFICGDVFKQISHLAKPIVRETLIAVKNKDWWRLVTLLGVDAACMVIPNDVPLKGEICGVLGKTLEFAKDTATEAANAGKEAGEFLIDTGEGIVKGVGGALEGACKSIGICDDGGKKLMSGEQYYKYRLFPYIHDRVILRLTKGQSGLGHDATSKNACLNYYGHPIWKKYNQDMAKKIDAACNNLGQRLHNEADALAKAFQAAPAPYFESSVRPLVPTFVVEGYGQNKTLGYKKFVQDVCVTNMRATFPIIEPAKKGTTAWSLTCGKVVGLFNVAYQAEEKKLAASIAKMVGAGCFPPKGWSASQGLKFECDNYDGYAQCLTALAPGLEKKHCSLNQKKADEKLAKKIAAQLGAKRCKADGINVVCTRPWKQEKCQALRNQMTAGVKSQLQCQEDPIAAAAFAVLVKQAQDIVLVLNGGMKKSTSMKTEKGEGLAVFIPGTADHCKTAWDPLAIDCKNPEATAALGDKKLSHCPYDPKQDGADVPCLFSLLKADSGKSLPVKAAQGLPAIGDKKSAPKTRTHPIAAKAPVAPSVMQPITPSRASQPPTRMATARLDKSNPPPTSATPPMLALKIIPAALPDVGANQTITVGANQTQAGGTTSVDGASLRPRGDGTCTAPLRYTVANTGAAASAAFVSAWRNSAVPGRWQRQWSPLAAGASRTETDMVPLKPGANTLTLALDDLKQLKESNEANNFLRIVVNVGGDCAPAGRRAAPAGRLSLPGR